MLVVWLRKQIITQKLAKLKKKLTDHNKPTAEKSAARLKYAN